MWFRKEKFIGEMQRRRFKKENLVKYILKENVVSEVKCYRNVEEMTILKENVIREMWKQVVKEDILLMECEGKTMN